MKQLVMILTWCFTVMQLFQMPVFAEDEQNVSGEETVNESADESAKTEYSGSEQGEIKDNDFELKESEDIQEETEEKDVTGTELITQEIEINQETVPDCEDIQKPTDVIDLNETIVHARERIHTFQNELQTASLIDQGTVVSNGRLAQFDSLISPGAFEYITMFTLNGKPVYCVEPNVLIQLNGTEGPYYLGSKWDNVAGEAQLLCKRIAYFGYGHPMTGNSYDAYVATQMLIWQIVAPDEYTQINSTLNMCGGPIFAYQACSMGRGDVDTLMGSIMNLVNNYDTVPSFADEWHGIKTYSLDWGETLDLTDHNHVLSWFNTWSDQSHEGINIKFNNEHMYVDIDDLYYEGWNSPNGKTLTFRRTDDQWNNMTNGILLYTSGANQKMFGESSMDPTPSYSLSFKLKTADIEIEKLNEYYERSNLAAGTSFYVGWYEDPETQYQKTGKNDLLWMDIHDASIKTKDDLDGNSNILAGEAFYYPIMEPDGKTIRKFTVGYDGVLRIKNFLPQSRRWWIREVSTTNPYVLDQRPWSVNTGVSGSKNHYSFVNALRDVTLELVKIDEENNEIKIDGAEYEVFEIGDLDYSKEPVKLGTEVNLNRAAVPRISYAQLKEFSDMKIGDSFEFGEFVYEILSSDKTSYLIKGESKIQDQEKSHISVYQAQTIRQIGDEITIETTLGRNGTVSNVDDRKIVRKLKVVKADGNKLELSGVDDGMIHLYTELTSPAFSDFQSAAIQQDKELSKGEIICIAGNSYIIRTVNDGSLTAETHNHYELSLDDITPDYDDLPEPESLRCGDRFELTRLIFNGEVYQTEKIGFEVSEYNTKEITLLNEMGTFIVKCPEWIGFTDLPDQIQNPQKYEVRQIVAPAYQVEDTRGNRYLVKKGETIVIENVNDAKPSDVKYRDIIGSDEGSMCTDPDDVSGCPVGLQRIKEFPVIREVEYSGPQYAEIQNQAAIEKDGVVYTKMTDDEICTKISFAYENAEYIAELFPDHDTELAYHTEKALITFKILERSEKEYILDWKTQVVPKNSKVLNSTLHLFPYESHITALTYNSIPEEYRKQDKTFTDHDGNEYRIIYHDDINHLIVAESSDGRFEISLDSSECVSPVSYQELVQFERERNMEVQIGDIVSNTYQENPDVNDIFTYEGIDYLIVSKEFISDRSNNTLDDNDAYIWKVLYSPTEGYPISLRDILNSKMDTDRFTLEKYAIDDLEVYTLKDQLTNSDYRYYLETVRDTKNRDPYEEQSASIQFQVQKPEGPVYDDLMLSLYAPKQKGNHLTYQNERYLIVQSDDQKVILENCNNHEILEIDAETETEAYENVRSIPIDLQKGDVYRIDCDYYKLIDIEENNQSGMVYRVKRQSDHRTFEIRQQDEDIYDSEQILFLQKNQQYDLQELFGEGIYSLIERNPHVSISEENEHTWMIADGYSIVGVLKSYENLDPVRIIRIIFSDREESINGFKVFKGQTGSAYVRLVDETNHNMPLGLVEFRIYSDELLQNLLGTFQTDESGTANVSSLDSGVYFYQNPLSGKICSFTVESSETRTGSLRISELKWGREYMACEVKLPDGYDYGDNDVCHTFTLDASQGIDVIESQLENRLRRIKLKVYKVDQENNKTPLNNAWFAVTDVNDMDLPLTQSTYKERVGIEDIPKDASAGDEFAVWKPKENGINEIYRVEKILSNKVMLSKLIDGRFQGEYMVPTEGYSENAPMLYIDIEKNMLGIAEGKTFSVMQKEAPELIKVYKVISIVRDKTLDVFGNPTQQQDITEAVIQECHTDNSEMITVKNLSERSDYQTHTETYVSGGVLVEQKSSESDIPYKWSELKLMDLEKGMCIEGIQKINARMPSYSLVDQSIKRQESILHYDEEDWEITSGECYQISIDGQTFEIRENTVPGAVTINKKNTGTISEMIYEDGVLTGVIITQEDGSSWTVNDATEHAEIERGTAGVRAILYSDTGKCEYVADGYTFSDGRLLFSDLENGTYILEINGERQKVEVERGTIIVPDIKYGHKIQICETRSPLGYMIGNSCTVIQPKTDYAEGTVDNYRPNSKFKTTIRQILRTRKMGEFDEKKA